MDLFTDFLCTYSSAHFPTFCLPFVSAKKSPRLIRPARIRRPQLCCANARLKPLMHSSLSFAARSYSPSGYHCKKQQSTAGIASNNFPTSLGAVSRRRASSSVATRGAASVVTLTLGAPRGRPECLFFNGRSRRCAPMTQKPGLIDQTLVHDDILFAMQRDRCRYISEM